MKGERMKDLVINKDEIIDALFQGLDNQDFIMDMYRFTYSGLAITIRSWL